MNKKVRNLLKEVKLIRTKIEELPDYTQQSVLTKDMVQAIINDLYTSEMIIQNVRKLITKDLSIHPDEDSPFYDMYPSCHDFLKRKHRHRSNLVEIMEEYGEYGDGEDDDSDRFLDGWLSGRKVDEEIDG